MLEPAAVAARFLDALAHAELRTTPFRHWLPANILPETVLRGMTALPVAPPDIGDTAGRRETHNATRWFFGTEEQLRFPVCHELAHALQQQAVTEALAESCAVDLRGSFLRIEYCMDADGFWLEPHTDIGAKFFTMLIYLAEPPLDEDWGTDIYADPATHAGTAPCQRNHGLIFIPGADTWHGFAKRKITGTRRSLIVNYVTKDWRARHELAFPDQPVF